MLPTRSVAVVALAFGVVACGSAEGSRLDRVEERLASTSRAYAASEREVAELRQLAMEIQTRTESARRDWLAAKAHYEQARADSTAASALWVQAEQDYQTAARRYRTALTIMIAAAASDLFLRGLCGPNVSTRQYRRHLRAQGARLDGIDIDHIFARSRGGPDRPWNYLPLEASVNRSLGAGGLGWKLTHFPLETLEAVAKMASHSLLC